MCRPSQTPHLTASSTWIRAAEARGRWSPRWSPAPPARAGPAPREGGGGPARRGGGGPGAARSRVRTRVPRQNVGPEGAPLPPDRMSEITSGVVVFQGPTASGAASHLFYASRVISRSRTRVKLNHFSLTGPRAFACGHFLPPLRVPAGPCGASAHPGGSIARGISMYLKGGPPPRHLGMRYDGSPPPSGARGGSSPRDCLRRAEGSPVPGCLARGMLAPRLRRRRGPS